MYMYIRLSFCCILSMTYNFVNYTSINLDKMNFFLKEARQLPSGPVVKNPPANAGNTCSLLSNNIPHAFSSIQFTRSVVSNSATPWTTVSQASLSINNSRSLLKLTSIKSVMPSNHPILCCPLLLPPSIFPSIRIFSNESVLHIRWPKYWSFSFSISPSSEYSGLISYHLHITFSSVVLRQLKACFLWHQCSHEHKQIWSLVIQIMPNMLILIYKRVTCKFFWRNSICSLREALTNGLCGKNFF